MPHATPQGPHRRTLAIKHQDGEPLTRVDLQYDLLHHIFSNPIAAFTDPFPCLEDKPSGTRVTFRDLYINCLINSPRCSKTSHDKISSCPEFAVEFGKISLLSNVGRINTTMAFFPEMRTALRTYHPVPSLQKADGNLQDAPRIKNILKSCLLPDEAHGTISTPSEVLARQQVGAVPPTSIVNLVFVFSAHAPSIARAHFGSNIPYDFLDLFSPIPVSSESRARAFLWLCYHYHEPRSPNPFATSDMPANATCIPRLRIQTTDEAVLENVDTPDEVAWGERMRKQRQSFTEAHQSEETQAMPKPRGAAARSQKRKADSLEASVLSSSSIPSMSVQQAHSFKLPRQPNSLQPPAVTRPPGESCDHFALSEDNRRRFVSPDLQHNRAATVLSHPDQYLSSNHSILRHRDAFTTASSSSHSFGSPPEHRPNNNDGSIFKRARTSYPTTGERYQERAYTHLRSPYVHTSHFLLDVHPRRQYTHQVKARFDHRPASVALPSVSGFDLLRYEFRRGKELDPLADDDFGTMEDRASYELRQKVLSRLRGKSPTPPLE